MHLSAKIAVVYLARLKEGFQSFEAFAETYRLHPAGQAHDLVIICKGFSKPGEFAAVSAIFTGIPHKIISMPDDIGLDIHAYREAARKVSSEYICCLNTFTLLRTDNWLQKLWTNISKPGVGMVGATGSFESLYTSYKVIQFVAWASPQPTTRFDRHSAVHFAWLLNGWAPHTIRASKSVKHRVRRLAGDILRNRSSLSQLQDQMPRLWADQLSHNGGLREFRDVPHFPNPHIRSNAFMVRKADLLSVSMDGPGKFACCNFESGREGLSLSLLNRGLQLLVVGADGVGYPMEQWPTCGAFRSGTQSNLLAADNQTRTFNDLSPGDRLTHEIFTWGGYGPGIQRDIKLFGVSFDGNTPLAERMEFLRTTPKAARQRLISIAIPTHNRLSLVLDAIQTVVNQKYDNWEICVFDNASKEPIAAAISALNDSRIRVQRSEKFLPVTESWNGAVDMTKGEFITMIGDDDGVTPGFFERINYLADRFDNPDLIFSNLYQFMHPGVVPGRREGYVADLPMADFLQDADRPFLVDPKQIRTAVDNSLNMRRSFMFNMSAFCCSRDLLERMRVNGRVMRSPFPDYYFANLALHLANKVVGEPRRMAFQGVSKVSFGFTMINAKIDDGFKVLNHDVENDSIYGEVAKHLLPGSRYRSEYIVTMAYLADALGDQARRPDFDHYRRVQMWEHLKSRGTILLWLRSEKFREMWGLLSFKEKRWLIKGALTRTLASRFPRFWRKTEERLNRQSSAYLFEAKQIMYRIGEHVTLFDVFKELEKGPFSAVANSEMSDDRPRKTRLKQRAKRVSAPIKLVSEAKVNQMVEVSLSTSKRPTSAPTP